MTRQQESTADWYYRQAFGDDETAWPGGKGNFVAMLATVRAAGYRAAEADLAAALAKLAAIEALVADPTRFEWVEYIKVSDLRAALATQPAP